MPLLSIFVMAAYRHTRDEMVKRVRSNGNLDIGAQWRRAEILWVGPNLCHVFSIFFTLRVILEKCLFSVEAYHHIADHCFQMWGHTATTNQQYLFAESTLTL